MPERSPEAAELVARAAQAIDLARAAGASAAAASASRSRAVELGLRDGVLEKVQESTSRGLSLELYVDGRYSSHSTTDLRPDRLQAFVAEAVALTRALQPDPLRVLPDPALYPKGAGPELDLVDPAVVHMRREDRVAALQEVGAGFAGAAGVISWTAGLNDSHGLSARVSSDGFEGVHESTSAWMGAEVTLQDPSGARPEDWHWGGGHHLSDRPAPASIAPRALELAKQRLGAGKGPTRRTLMVVDPRAAGRLVGALLGPAHASAVQQGRSFWASRRGQPVISPKLRLWDDPLRRRGLGSRPWDGEGLASRELPLVQDGALVNLYVDTYYGRKANLPPTTGGQSNLRWALGDRDLAAILAAADDAIYVTSWLGGNSDPTTGDFSFGLRGHRVEKGVLGPPIGEMNVTGDLIGLFAGLVEVGNNPYPWSSQYPPTLVFDGVQFSGA
jgi:PmbA protein